MRGTLASIRELAKQAAAYVALGAVPMESFCSIVIRCNEIEEELQGLVVSLRFRCISIEQNYPVGTALSAIYTAACLTSLGKPHLF